MLEPAAMHITYTLSDDNYKLEPGREKLHHLSDIAFLAARCSVQILVTSGKGFTLSKSSLKSGNHQERKKRKITPLGVITGASRPRGSPRLLP